MPEFKNAKEFINSYNKIDAKLRDLYGFKPSQPFADVVRRRAEKSAAVRKYENDLLDYARLRNAIVHQSTDGRVIAVPCDDVVEEIRHIEKLICTPPTVGQALKEKKIVSIEDTVCLRQAVLLMARSGFSNIPVYRGGKTVGILNNRRILRQVGAVIENCGDLDEYFGKTPVGDVVSESDLNVYFKFLSKKNTLQEIVSAFEENRKLLAVVISENGLPSERVVNFVTAADLVGVNKILEDYQ